MDFDDGFVDMQTHEDVTHIYQTSTSTNPTRSHLAHIHNRHAVSMIDRGCAG